MDISPDTDSYYDRAEQGAGRRQHSFVSVCLSLPNFQNSYPPFSFSLLLGKQRIALFAL
jgi:hypothetical protein